MQQNVNYSVTCDQLRKMICDYEQRGGEVVCLDDGSLTEGTIIFRNNGLPLWEFVSTERYLNEWSSEQIIRKYKSLPKKWHKIADDFLDYIV